MPVCSTPLEHIAHCLHSPGVVLSELRQRVQFCTFIPNNILVPLSQGMYVVI